MATQSIHEVHEHSSCEIFLTNSCNMHCEYCIARDLPSSAITTEIAHRSVDMFIYLAEGCRTIEITFTGGEPLLVSSTLEDLICYTQERAYASDMQASLVLKTNGTLLNPHIISLLRSNSVRVVVSIDGISAVHDKHRKGSGGKGTHRIVSHNLRELLLNEVSCVASMTIHPDSSSAVLEGVQYLHELGLRQIDIGPAYGTVTWTDTETLNLGRSLMDVGRYMGQVNKKHCQIDIGPLYRDSEHVGGMLSDNWGCHAGSTNLAFLPNGQIAGCSALAMLTTRFPDLVLGDVFNGLEQQAVDRILGLAQAGIDNRTKCRECQVSANCTGGCIAINFSTTGIPLSSPAIYCQTISIIPEAWHEAWADAD